MYNIQKEEKKKAQLQNVACDKNVEKLKYKTNNDYEVSWEISIFTFETLSVIWLIKIEKNILQ